MRSRYNRFAEYSILAKNATLRNWRVLVCRCSTISVVGLWAGDMNAETCLKKLETIRALPGMSQMRVREVDGFTLAAAWLLQ